MAIASTYTQRRHLCDCTGRVRTCSNLQARAARCRPLGSRDLAHSCGRFDSVSSLWASIECDGRRSRCEARRSIIARASDTEPPRKSVHRKSCSVRRTKSFRLFSRLVERVTARRLLGGNDIVPLTNGIEAYPAMLQAIEAAKNLDRTFHLHFRWRGWREAVRGCSRTERTHRGVEVRVLIDAVGANYSWPPVARRLTRARSKRGAVQPPSDPTMGARPQPP